jgi:hypothetical protein
MTIDPDKIRDTYWGKSDKEIAAAIAEAGGALSQDQVLLAMLNARLSHRTKWMAIMTGVLAAATVVLAITTICG